MSRRPWLAAAALLVALSACATSQPTTGSPTPSDPVATAWSTPDSATGSASQTSTSTTDLSAAPCADAVAALTPRDAVAQLFMVGVDSQGPGTAARRVITDERPGFVLLLGNTAAGVDGVLDLTDGIRELVDGVPIVVAVDQEGGEVQRLRGEGFSDMPTAVEQAALPIGDLRAAAQTWGEELVAAGVLFDLAPVADTVPEAKRRSNAPIGRLKRNYGFGDDVERAVVEAVEGFDAGGVATSLKHFPGLGKVTDNTDFAVAHDDAVVAHDPDWAVFSAAIDAGADSVMVSSAIYENLDPEQPAMFSRTVVTDILRGELGYDGLVISDDVGAAVAVANIEPGERAVRFLSAGGDIVINADPNLMSEMVDAVVAAAEDDETLAAHLQEAGARVLTLKQSLGLPVCD